MPQPQRESWKVAEAELFRLLVENVRDYAVFVLDPQGQVQTWNPGAERLLGYREDEIVGRSVNLFFTPEDVAAGVPQREMREALTEGGGNDDRWHVRKDGSRFWAGGLLTPLRDEAGNVRGFAKIMRDRTEWKIRTDATRERDRLAAFTREVGLALVRSDTLPDMLRHCAEAMVRHLDGAFARVWTLNPQGDVLEIRASAGMYTHLDGPHSRVPVGKYKIGLIAQEKKPHLTNDVVDDPRVSDPEWARREGMVAFAGYPLVVDGRVVGVMAMFARHRLTTAVLEALASVANAVAVGVERKLAEEQRRTQQEWLAVTLASIGDAVIATDTAGRVTFLNGVAQALTGWAPADARGQPLEAVFEILHEQTRQPVENPVATVLKEGRIVGLGNHTVLVARDGAVRPIDDSAAPIRDPQGNLLGVVLIFRDVTEQRRAEREVRTSEARKAAIVQTALDCIITMDQDGNVVEFNPAAEKTFGYRREQVVGRPLAEFIIPPALRDRHHRGMVHYLATGEGPVLGRRLELPALRADGTEFPVELAITRIPTDGPALFTAYLRDITQRTRAEQHRSVRLAVVDVLNQAAGGGDAAGGVLRAVGENLGWDVGFFWTVSDEGTVLRCTESWHRPESPAAEFEETSCRRSFRSGEGLPGTVWADRRPTWLLDVTSAPNFPRAASAARYGLHSAFACPVVVGEQVLGVIEFFSRRLREPDAELLEVMATVAGNLGQFVERRRAEAALQRSEERFRSLMEQAPFSIQVFAPDGRTVRVNRAWEELWGTRFEQIGGYNVLEDRQLDARGVLDHIRQGFAGQAARVPAIQYDPNETIPDITQEADPRRWLSAVIYPLKDADGRVREVVLIHEDITARKRAEDALVDARQELERRVAERTAELMRANEFMKALLENVQTGVVACDADGVLTLFNRVTRRLHGLPEEPLGPEEWAGRYGLFGPDGRTPLAPEDIPLYRALQGERVRDAEMVIRPEGQPPRTVEASGQAFFDAQGVKLGAVVSMHDVTARKQAEEGLRRAHEALEQRVEERTAALARANAALRESEEKLRLLADTIPQLAWMARPDGHIFWYNRRWYEYTGTTPAQMEGWGWQAVHDPAVLPAVLERWKRSIATGEPFDMVFPLRGVDGRFRPFLTRVNPLTDDGGRTLYWFGTNTDISEQQRASDIARFLADASATLAAVVDYGSTLGKLARLAVPFFADWCVVDMTSEDGALERLAVVHGDPSKVALADELYRRYPPRPDDPYGPPHVLRTGRPEMATEITDAILVASAQDEDHLRILRGLNLRSYISVPLVARARPLGVVTFILSESHRTYTPADLELAHDLAHRAAIAVDNAQLYQALREADRRKDEFLATLAHELRNPLAPIRNSLQILKMPGIDAARVRQTREMMERQVHHLVRLVDDLLDVSRVMRGKIELRTEPVELAAVIARAVETVKPLIDVQRHQLDISLPPDALLLDADPVRLSQVVGNLLTNSAKYTEPNGRIWLTARREGDQAALRVRDSGIGIAPDLLPHVFELFVQADNATTRAQGGLGIGLTLVKNLVEMHGGTVEAHSEGLGKGCEFVVRLPLAARQVREPVRGGSDRWQEKLVTGYRLLVVDDNADAADSLALLLRLQGHEVRAAHDGHAALELATTYRPDLVFLDIGMPGMDGYEVARRLRQVPGLEHIVLAALTGWGQPEDRHRTAEAGFDHHLVKPPEPATLESVVASLKPREGQ